MPEKTTHQKTIIITGASDGIGAAAAKQLSALGHRVVIVGRSPEKTRRVAEEIGAPYLLADFTVLAEVRQLADTILADYPVIDVLANNAGGVMGDRETTIDGYEKTFQVNHLAPFLLTNLLRDRLIESRTAVLNTSSIASKLFGHVKIDDLSAEEYYNPVRAYGAAKLENVLFTSELHRRFHPQGISTVAFHPGNIASNFTSESNPFLKAFYRPPLRNLFLKSPETGGEVLTWFATATPGTDWISGDYYDKTKHATPNKQVDEPGLARKLWERSAELVGVDA